MKAKFASVADLEEKQATFVRLSEHCRGYTAAGDPNTGVIIIIIIGDDSVLIVDTQATPVMAARLVAEIRRLTDKPIKHVVLSHYHAVRVLGASAYRAEVLQEVIASQGTYEMIVERGAQDMPSEYERFPRLFQAFGSIPGLTRPTLVFKETMTLWMGGLEVRRRPHPRRHRRGLGAVREGAVFGRPGRASSRRYSSPSTSCRSTSCGRSTKPTASGIRGSGRQRATGKCGTACRPPTEPPGSGQVLRERARESC